MKTIKADILSNIDPNKLTIILHGCNCFHTMGAGIAKYLANKFPEVLQADQTTVKGGTGKLGSFSIATINPNLFVVNCYTQHYWGACARLEYIENCLATFIRYGGSKLPQADIRLPMIGCGFGGLKWDDVEPICSHYFFNLPATVYYL